MKIIQFELGGVEYIRRRQCWLGRVSLTLQAEGEMVAHNIDIKVRVKGDLTQSYAEVEEAIRSQAIEVLSRAKSILAQSTADELFEQLRPADRG